VGFRVLYYRRRHAFSLGLSRPISQPEIPITGNCKIRTGVFTQTSTILGNQVWLDANKNGRQESYEHGVGGICVNLYDDVGQLAESTTTDSNGYYGFNVEPAKYSVEFILPAWLSFTSQNIGMKMR